MGHFFEYKSLIYLPFVKTYTITSILAHGLTARAQLSMSKVCCECSYLPSQLWQARRKKDDLKCIIWRVVVTLSTDITTLMPVLLC